MPDYRDDWGRGRWAFFERKFAEVAIDGPVLEIGCGGNLDHKELFGQRYEYRTCDPDPAANANDCARAEALPYPSGAFGAVIMADVIEHIFPPDAAMSEVKRVLKSGGHFLTSVPLFGPGEHGDFCRYTRRGLECLLGQGWSAVAIEGVGDNRHPGDSPDSTSPKHLGYVVHATKG